MLTYLRYALATCCFAASVGCLALWWATSTQRSRVLGPAYVFKDEILCLEFFDGTSFVFTEWVGAMPQRYSVEWQAWPQPIDEWRAEEFEQIVATNGTFGTINPGEVYCPLWYPALIFALAGVAALRFRRQFSIRSALVAVSVVATLLGMVVAL